MRNDMTRQKREEATAQRKAGEVQQNDVTAVDITSTSHVVKKLIDTPKLMEKILSRENMKAALRRVQSNKGCSGIDGMEVSELLPYLQANWEEIKATLIAGKYEPRATKTIKIPKKDGSHRELRVATVLDRLIQQAIMQILQSYMDSEFSNHSYGFRPGRSAHQALAQVKKLQEQGYEETIDIYPSHLKNRIFNLENESTIFVQKFLKYSQYLQIFALDIGSIFCLKISYSSGAMGIDIEKYFDRVNHDKLMSKLNDRIQDQRVLDLIRRYLNKGIRIGEGVPQGSAH